jgi:hypothetical protein
MEVISHDQSTFLPTRFILNNIFFTHETIQWAKKSKQSLILKLDFSKAYNKVEWTFSFDCMRKLGILDEFVNMTKILFKDVKVKVNINGKPFGERGLARVPIGTLLVPYSWRSIECNDQERATRRKNFGH